MDGCRLVFHPGASKDYWEAFTWYARRVPTIALDFEREVERGLRLVREAPLRWPLCDATRRRFVLRKYPYSLIYRLRSQVVEVLAVAHGKRKPGYWRGRAFRR